MIGAFGGPITWSRSLTGIGRFIAFTQKELLRSIRSFSSLFDTKLLRISDLRLVRETAIDSTPDESVGFLCRPKVSAQESLVVPGSKSPDSFGRKRIKKMSHTLCPPLLLLPKHLPVGLAIGIKAPVFASLPLGFEFGCRDVPVRTAFFQYSAQVLPQLFDGRPAKKPVAIIDLEYHETRFEDDDMRDHGIVIGVRILGDVEILLNLSSRIGQKGPMSADAGAVLIRRKHVVGTDRDYAGVTDFHLVVKLDQALRLADILRTVSSPA